MSNKRATIKYDENRLKQTLQLNAEGVSVKTLLRSFGLKDEEDSKVRASLQALITEGFAFQDKREKFYATNPLSDLVIARVSKSLNKNQLDLAIENIDADFPFPVTMSTNQIKKMRGSKIIRTGERIAVVLSRHNGTELKARLIGKFTGGKGPSLVGHFNRYAGIPTFIPYDTGIRTEFAAKGAVPAILDSKKSYWAAIPADLDPYAPSLEIGEQKWDPDTGTPIATIIAKKHGVKVRHEKEAMIEAKAIVRQPLPLAGRRDLTSERILVIDPMDARDHDDGIMIQHTKDGFRSLVVIADVPFYVRPGTVLDNAARERGFTHYFPDQTFHMLPQRLVHSASLKAGATKPVIYVEQYWDDSGNPLGFSEIGAGYIAAQKQMTYGHFEDLVIAHAPETRAYTELGDTLLARMRFEKGLNFDTTGLDERAPYSQALVAAMMIEANVSIAEYLRDKEIPFLTRSHTGSDNVFEYDEAREKLEEWGYDLPSRLADVSSNTLNDIIRESELKGQKQLVESFIRSKFLHQAVYTTMPHTHFGLNRDHYTHATSPVRRYADIITLRAVHTSLGHDELGLSEDDIETMQKTAMSLNTLQDQTRRVCSDMQKYYATRDLLRLEGHMVRATLAKVRYGEAEIILHDRYGLRKQFKIAQMGEVWSMGKNGKSLVFNGKTIVDEGSAMRVSIANVRPHQADWDIAALEPAGIRHKGPGHGPVLVAA